MRIRLEGCRLVSFLKWFESGQGRETSPWREFQEELVASGLVPAHLFPNIFHEKLWDVRKFRWSEPIQGYELLLAEIHEMLPTPAQVNALRDAVGQHPEELRLFSDDEVLRGGTAVSSLPRYEVSLNSRWLLSKP